MSYKTILVHVDGAASAEPRFRVAADLALYFNAHLIGCAPTGISRFIPPDVIVQTGTPLADFCTAMRAAARDSLERFVQIVSEQDLPAPEKRVIDDDASGLAVHARYVDLVVVSQPDSALPTLGSAGELPAYLPRATGRPLLVVPRRSGTASLEGNAVVAWDGSMEATRAITAALPLLRAMGSASVIVIHRSQARTKSDGASCVAMVRYLRSHGISTKAIYRPDAHEVGATLLSTVHDEHAGLLVMGSYGHSPVRESLFGGVTATVLLSATLPVLLAH